MLKRFIKKMSGQAMVEYALILALIALAAAGVVGNVGEKVTDVFDQVVIGPGATDPDKGDEGEAPDSGTTDPDKGDEGPEPELIRLGDVPQGGIVYDATWTWNFLNAGAMSGERHIDWIVATHNHSGYPQNSTTLYSKEVLKEMAYDSRTWTNEGLQSNKSDIMNPFLTNARSKFGANFQNGMMRTSFTNKKAGQIVGPQFNQWVDAVSYTDSKYLFNPSQVELGGGETGTFGIGSNWGLFPGNSEQKAKMGTEIMNYWTRSIHNGHQGGKTVDSIQYFNSLYGRFSPYAAALSSGIGARPATNFKSDTMVELQEDGRYKMAW